MQKATEMKPFTCGSSPVQQSTLDSFFFAPKLNMMRFFLGIQSNPCQLKLIPGEFVVYLKLSCCHPGRQKSSSDWGKL